MDLASKMFNYACGWRINQGQAMLLKKFAEKFESTMWRKLWNGSRSENYDVLISFSVMLMLIYDALMMLLIPIRPMQLELVKTKV
jgi:hypothetical protein